MSESWQTEKDLLDDGRKYLEQLCSTTRYRHLFPTRTNLALLFRAYQDLDRWRTVRRRALEDRSPGQLRRERRRFRRVIKRLVQADALARDRRLLWHYPLPRARPLRATPPPIVLEALHEVDSDARADVEARVRGRPAAGKEEGGAPMADPSGSMVTAASSGAASSSGVSNRLERGLAQFRDALINAALANPRQIPRLHPQYLQFVTSPPPLHRKHPIATMVLVKLPLQLLMTLVLIFNVVYLAAYHFFNDERLGQFLGDKISGLLDGDLTFGSVHWSPLLIVDLLTGQPTRLRAHDVAVWEAHKHDGRERTRKTAYAEHVEVELVIHEIIPWNRLGIPGMVEIPWVLHFEDIQNRGELWVDVRAYRNHERDGEWMLSLIDAFDTYQDLSGPPELKKLSYRIDRAQLDGLVFHLDMEDRSGWGTRIEFAELEAALDFEGWAPIDGRPQTLPLRYELDARGGTGDLVITPIVEGAIPIAALRRLELSSGMNFRPLGDMWVRGDADLGGSPSVFEGSLLDVFGQLAFDFRLGTTDYGPMAALMFPAKPDERGQPRSMIAASGSPASLRVTGPVDDVVLQAVGQGLTLDLFPEPGWALSHVDVSLTLARDPRPEMWAELGLPTGEGQIELDKDELDAALPERAPGGNDAPELPDDGQRWIVYLDTFRGSALDGEVRLRRRTGEDHVVLAGPGEPLLVSVHVDMIDVDLGRLAPHDPELRGLLAGRSSGGVQIHQVVIDDDGLDRVEAELQRVAITRTRGPDDDHLPRNLRVDGEVIWDADEGLDLRGVRIVVDGGQLRLSGGIDADFDELGPTHASVRVDDGEAFLRAFGMPRWFDTLAADFSASGPLANPRGSGSLDISGAGSGALAVDDIEAARLEFKQGTLTLRSPSVAMLGGRGPLSADLVLLGPTGKALADPRLRLGLRLEDIDRPDILGSGIGAKDAAIELIIDDGADKPVPLSQLHARGGAYADTLTLAGVDYRDAEASFAFTREGIEIDRMTLAYHRPVSPSLFSSATVAIGHIELQGTIGFHEDPSLALEVRAANVPLSALAATLDTDLPIRGQITSGSRVGVTGSLRKPQIEGQLVLAQLGAAGIPLGGGALQVSSKDVPHQPADPEHGRAATGAHRRVEIEGSLAGKPNKSSRQGDLAGKSSRQGDLAGRTSSEGELDWRIDATVAFGGAPRNQIEAAVDLRFANLPFDTLLTHPNREQWRTQVVGGLHDLVIETRYCPSHENDLVPLLEQCAEVDPDDPRLLAGEPLRINLRLAHLWYRGRDGSPSTTVGGDLCFDRDTTCSIDPLVARLEGTQLSLARPWTIRSGGKHGPVLEIDGTFDLRGIDKEPGENEDLAVSRCVPGIPDNPSLPLGTTAATVTGGLDFSAFAPFLAAAGVRPEGRLDIDLDIAGVITRPTVTGYMRLPADQPIALAIEDPSELASRPGNRAANGRRSRPIPVEVSKLDLRMAGGTVYVEGKIEVFDQILHFGEINNRHSFVDIAGPCSGRYALAAAGGIDGALVRRLLPSVFESSGGAVDLRELFLAGDLTRFGQDDDDDDSGFERGDELFAVRDPLFDIFGGTLSFDRKAVRLGVQDLGEIRIASGLIEFRQCTRARPCNPGTEYQRTRGIAIWAGGRRAALSSSRPSDALTLRLGDRGRADLWGELVLTDSFDALESITLAAAAKTFPFSLTDNSGRTELEAELSADRLIVAHDGVNGRISGDVLIERSAWLRDARQGVTVLSFADPNPAPPSQLPEFLRRLELDMTLRTAEPFRVDNNVAKRLEATADLRLVGFVGDPDLSGTIVVERGVVDLDILGGAYDVARGRVLVQHDLSQSTVDLRAVRQKPIKVNSQLLTLNLTLSGPLDAIQWECSAPGDTSGAVASTRGCVDYLIFDAGNTDIATSDVRENRNNNNLIGTRFLPLAGRLTQLEVNEVIERENPQFEERLPELKLRVDGVGVVIDVSTRPEWGRWGWGRLGLNFIYVRGYPGAVLRDSRTLSGRLEILEDTSIEAAFGVRNYSNQILVLDPTNPRSIEVRQRLVAPSRR